MAFAISTDQQAEEVRNQKINIYQKYHFMYFRQEGADTLLQSFFRISFLDGLCITAVHLERLHASFCHGSSSHFGAQPQLIFIVHQNGCRGVFQADANALLFKFCVLIALMDICHWTGD